MQPSILESSFVSRLRNIISSRYGKGLQIRQLMDLADLGSEEMYLRGADLHIPIRMNKMFLGTAIIPSASDMDYDNRESVLQLVRMVLEPAMYKWYLDQKQANLSEVSKIEPDLSNIELFGDEKREAFIEKGEAEESVLESASEANQLVCSLIHLEGTSAKLNLKIAHQIRDITSRWAFVPFADIKGQIHSSFDISKLGSMVIFIEDVETLNAAEQELLNEYLEEAHFDDEPLLITTSKLSSEELVLSDLNSNLVDELLVNNFEVDRAPVAPNALKEVLKLFFWNENPQEFET